MTPNQTQGIGHQKYPTYVHGSTLSLVRFSLRSAIFEIFHILGFPLTPILKFQIATKCLKKLSLLARIVIACIAPWQRNVLTKFG